MTRSCEPEQTETVIVGGGQAGLATAYHLKRRGRPFVVLHADARIGDTWRSRWDSLQLFTPAKLSSLPGMRFPGPASHFPSRDEFADYLEAYAGRFGFDVRARVRVDRILRNGSGYRVIAGERSFEADHVVLATGAHQEPQVPVYAPELAPGIVQLHSSAYRNPRQLQEGGVLVVGAGNSGAEIAIEVSRSGHQTWLSGRDTGEELPFRHGSLPDRLLTPPLWFLLSRVLTAKTPPGRWLRAKALTAGHPLVRVKPADITAAGVERVPRTSGVQDGYPVLEGGRVMKVSNVIWCTGFRPDFGWIDLPVFDDSGAPVHDRGVVASQPGLYVVGQVFLHSLTSSLIGGVGRDAEHIAKHIAAHA